ncbi:MAG TPA: hypothetical protein VMR02_02485, partial [Terracidiphilus sp.]|nr:hypothetical protein [Terracidiphilus sp.]
GGCLLHNQATSLCYLWSNDSGLSVIDFAWEPFRLYGSLRAVNVLLASCAPHCTALAPPLM